MAQVGMCARRMNASYDRVLQTDPRSTFEGGKYEALGRSIYQAKAALTLSLGSFCLPPHVTSRSS